MADKFWRPAVSGDWDSTSSWSTSATGATGAAKPTDGDDVYLDGTTISVTTGQADESGVTANSLNIVGPGESGDLGASRGWLGSLGADGAALNMAARIVRILNPVGRIWYGGNVASSTSVTDSGMVKIDGSSAGKNAITLSGSILYLEVANGNLSVAAAATLANGGSWKFLGGRSYVGACTMPSGTSTSNAASIEVGGGDERNAAWVELLALPTASGSSLTVRGSGAYCQAILASTNACPRVTVEGGATVKYSSPVAPTGFTVAPGGTLDLSDQTFSLASVPITHYQGATIIWPRRAVSLSVTETKHGRGARGVGGSIAAVSGFTGLGVGSSPP